MPFHLELLWGIMLMPHTGCVMHWAQNRILREGKNSSPILHELWTKVHKILRQCRGPLVLSNALARVSVMFHSEDIRH